MKDYSVLSLLHEIIANMKIEIVDDSSFLAAADNSRIEEIDDIIEVDTCFICNGKPKPWLSKTIYPDKGKANIHQL